MWFLLGPGTPEAEQRNQLDVPESSIIRAPAATCNLWAAQCFELILQTSHLHIWPFSTRMKLWPCWSDARIPVLGFHVHFRYNRVSKTAQRVSKRNPDTHQTVSMLVRCTTALWSTKCPLFVTLNQFTEHVANHTDDGTDFSQNLHDNLYRIVYHETSISQQVCTGIDPKRAT